MSTYTEPGASRDGIGEGNVPEVVELLLGVVQVAHRLLGPALDGAQGGQGHHGVLGREEGRVGLPEFCKLR